MPRKARMYLPDVPCHVIQRGNNRNACFFANQDYRFYLDCLEDACRRYRARIHAYVLMTNHVHLLITPQRKDSISRVVQSLGRRYVQYVNRKYDRTGTLWEGRHRASLVDEEAYLLTCMRYIEMNPVRAGLSRHPSEYPWSSFHCNGQNRRDDLVEAHALYKTLAFDGAGRARAYLALFESLIEPEELSLIRRSLNSSMPTGGPEFKLRIETMLERTIGHIQRGRPLGS